MAIFKIGDIVEDRVKGELLGRYLVSRIHFGSMIGTKFFLMSLTGVGVANGYHNSLEELEKATFSDSMLVVKSYEELQEETVDLKALLTHTHTLINENADTQIARDYLDDNSEIFNS
ncbi:hypothetical protein ACQKP0_24975 [Heyndrickxia sp. NPDC080065]|uniref:hypothetical protein n=1 Tax=Heyndrickxia sp. NPDC080065 TaxID=3390568 RepID=UPI003D0204C0